MPMPMPPPLPLTFAMALLNCYCWDRYDDCAAMGCITDDSEIEMVELFAVHIHICEKGDMNVLMQNMRDFSGRGGCGWC